MSKKRRPYPGWPRRGAWLRRFRWATKTVTRASFEGVYRQVMRESERSARAALREFRRDGEQNGGEA